MAGRIRDPAFCTNVLRFDKFPDLAHLPKEGQRRAYDEVPDRPLDENYSEDYQNVARQGLRPIKPEGTTIKEFTKIKRRAIGLEVRGRRLWKTWQNGKTSLVIDSETQQHRIVEATHKYEGHLGRDITYQFIRKRYWGKNLLTDISAYIAACPTCQKHAPWRPKEFSTIVYPGHPMAMAHFDHQHMPEDGNMHYVIELRCNMTGW